MTVRNLKTNEYVEIEFKKRGWGGKNANYMVATVKTTSGKPAYKVEGRYI